MYGIQDKINQILRGGETIRKNQSPEVACPHCEKLRTENVCLQELIQELYEWSRRDYPTEAEVREIMDRYHDLLNK
jgi:hypothetical protein